jgi:alkylation response protein AidB-like acyl-CoA dehydrogenase
MNFDFTDDQHAIKRTAQDFLASRYKLELVRELAEDERGFTDEQWSELVELGWPGVFIPESYGGLGLGAVELTVIAEELGYALAPSPLFSDWCAALLLIAVGSDEQRERWLPALAAGKARGTLASPDGIAADAGSADFLVLPRDGGHVLLETGQFVAEPLRVLDTTRKLFEASMQDGAGEALGDGSVDHAYATIATTIAAENVGVAQRTLEMAVEYAKDRKQFDRPIGAYQAVSHRCAQMMLETEGARSLTYWAAWALDHEPSTGPRAAAMAKVYAGDAGFRVPAAALQVHGGIGFTWEHDLHFFLKRGKANAHAFGDSRWHRDRVAELAGI